jgi:hypothetical protein
MVFQDGHGMKAIEDLKIYREKSLKCIKMLKNVNIE